MKENLQMYFFVTGEAPSKFVRLVYSYQISNDSNNSTDVVSCFTQQSKYVWSEHFLYLLGPRALLWSSFFAVGITENEVTIDLPCLCQNVHSNLLSRLT